MNIIRDEDMFGLMMIALLHQCGINRCNMKDCIRDPTTIITGVVNRPIRLCKDHYNEFKEAGKMSCMLDFSTFKK